MSNRPLEMCRLCNHLTGHAGIGDGSIFVGPCGPLCGECYGEIVDAIRTDWITEMELQINKLEFLMSNLWATSQIEPEFAADVALQIATIQEALRGI